MQRVESYFTLALLFLLGFSILYLPILFFLKKKGKRILRQCGYLGFAYTLFLIIFATILFTPITFQPETHSLNLIPFHWLGEPDWSQQLIEEKIPNVLLFIPLGFFIPIVLKSCRKPYKTLPIALGLTLGIEVFQYFIGRSSDIDDVISNLCGAVLGYALFQLSHVLFKQKNWWKKLIGDDAKDPSDRF